MTPIDIAHFQFISHMLLVKHFNVKLKNTDLYDDQVVKALIENKIAPHEAVNQLADKLQWVKCICNNRGVPSPYISHIEASIAEIQVSKSLHLMMKQGKNHFQ